MNRRGFLQASTATALLAAFPISTASAIALDPMATVLDRGTTIYVKLVRGSTDRCFWQCSLAYWCKFAPQYLRDGFEIAYIDVNPMPTELLRS